ncbi:MAG: cytochrome c oxidase accessory protein CcoG [Deltaproteobacteria bacterium]|nr:MAG: cytochrome c oxidase accessory protein CcoG [Deltaproteobacteria bacterium]
MKNQLPVLGQTTSSLRRDGHRNWVHPADVKGRFTSLRRWGFAALIAIYAVTPWITIGGHPAVFLDIARRKFYLFGATFNAQDFWLSFFLFSGIGFLLIVATALAGRVWCGYACPQTVFLEGVFRRIERLIEGPRSKRIKRNAGPMTFDKVWRKTVKHVAFVVSALAVAHIFLSYFVSLPGVFEMVQRNPAEHPEAFAWAMGMAGLMYGNFAFFREQLCLIVCPYGRLQSVLMDNDSIIVGYDEKRGEPRGKAKDPDAGACVSCSRCVTVCPTGIDIREGLQLDCIGCANCIDACDEVMGKLGRDPGLIRYDSLNGLEGKAKRFIRPRLFMYVVLGAVGLAVASYSLQGRTVYEANLLRQPGAPFVVTDDGDVRNAFEIHLVNKLEGDATFRIRSLTDDVELVIPLAEVTIGSLEGTHIPIFATVLQEDLDGRSAGREVRIEVALDGAPEETRVVTATFLAPGN